MTPRKPNSALRKMVWVIIPSNKCRTFAFVPGIKHNLQKHSSVLIRGGRARDIPGSKYKVVRGALDLRGVVGRSTARSKYGVKRTALR